MEAITSYLITAKVTERNIVKCWEEDIALPTYEIGEEEKNPIFLEKRVYQGSSGAVYPYAVVEKVYDEKREKVYRAVFLENEYIKIMILPELGGRVHMAFDKVKQRHFVYYNQVIKPALVGLTGPWISGGIEFNWPQHHRPSTFLPTDHTIEHNGDGSITVWCNEVERLFRMKGMQGFTVYPGKAYLEIRVKLYNRTSLPQTFLWWANPAVAVNDSYKSVFPPDVHAVFDHGKRDVSTFPIATGIYYKHDYSAGVDISKYKNIPVPTSYMAINSKYDFVGGYQDDQNAGLLHVANHHISPGKKQWTWGNGDFGKAWDRNLTDEDGPYIELMTGVYTDNQPDFSWLQPYEEKSWTQYFMPYAEVGYVKDATKDALINFEVENGQAQIILYTTSEMNNLRVLIWHKDELHTTKEGIDCSPRDVYRLEIEVGNCLKEDLRVELLSDRNKLLLSYQAYTPVIEQIPEAAKPAKVPQDILTIEQLFLTGQHLEQYRHATYNPADYYIKALSLDPDDIRCNNALGLIHLRNGKFGSAESYFRQAVKTQTMRNPNPYDGEPYYNLGLSLKIQKQYKEAYQAFYKATWNAAWQDAGFFSLTQIDSINHDWTSALDHIGRALIKNAHNHKARHLKCVILRKIGRIEEAQSLIKESLDIDNFNIGCVFEHYLLSGKIADLERTKSLLTQSIHTYLEYALDYAQAGLYEEAIELLLHAVIDEREVYPMVYYAIAYFYTQLQKHDKASDYFRRASIMPPDKCFPNRIEEVIILQEAIRINPNDPFAPYYLGNFWYSKKQYQEAQTCWKKSIELNENFPTALRNLSLVYYNRLDRKHEAKLLLEKAFSLDTEDARILMELNQLYKKLNISPIERFATLEQYLSTAHKRDDLITEYVSLLNQMGRYHEAMDEIDKHRFHPWEGGEGKIAKQYVLCRRELAKKAIAENDFTVALQFLHQTDSYPIHLGEGKLANAQENDLHYYKGIAYKGLGKTVESFQYLTQATEGPVEPQQAFFYNDPQPDGIFYQGLAFIELGNHEEANRRFNKLINHGKRLIFTTSKIDYFAVSLPDLAIWDEDLDVRNQIHCHYVMSLGHLGLRDIHTAKNHLEAIELLDINHIDSKIIKTTFVDCATGANL